MSLSLRPGTHTHLLRLLVAEFTQCDLFMTCRMSLSLRPGTHTHLLRLLVAEFTLTDNPANTTTSLLRLLCHADESVILGSWLEDTDQRSVEDQVRSAAACAGDGRLSGC